MESERQMGNDVRGDFKVALKASRTRTRWKDTQATDHQNENFGQT